MVLAGINLHDGFMKSTTNPIYPPALAPPRKANENADRN